MLLYNTLTRKKEEFVPYDGKRVGFYTCGPTVYHYAHIGNMRNYIGHDILDKTLRYLGYDVTRVMNITDVGHLKSDSDSGEDKMVASAKREHKSVMDIDDTIFFSAGKIGFQVETMYDELKKVIRVEEADIVVD